MSGTSSEADKAPQPEPYAYMDGWMKAEEHFFRFVDDVDPNFAAYKNPFAPGTPEHEGYEEALYVFTQK